jgi:Rrf2 family iron-sulfur cluster assembly transcriptional regulator
MILGTKARYAVMAMVELAGRDPEKPVTLAQLALSQEITVPYLEQIFSKLKHRGLVVSVRGPGGDYVLAHSADDTRISDIIEAVEEPIKMTRCENHAGEGCLSKKTRCLTHDLWDGLGKQIYGYLHGISLADVRSGKLKSGRVPDFQAARPSSSPA